MITDKLLKERELDELYDWVDSLELSKPKKNISRDFSDGTMMAEVIYQYFPKLVELHNYPPTNAIKSKLSNWTTLNNKVLNRLGLTLTAEDCKRLSSCTPLAVEALLFEFKSVMEDNKAKEQENKMQNEPFMNEQNKQIQGMGNKLYATSKADELKEVLSLLKQKISLVQRSIQRKDAHIRQLQEILKQYTN